MTGYTVHTGSTEKFSEGWDRIFKSKAKGGQSGRKKSTTSQSKGKSAARSQGKKKSPARKKRR